MLKFGIVAQTCAAGTWLDRNCGVRSVVISNALRVLPTLDPDVVRESIVLSVGRLATEKDLGTLIRAFAIVYEQNTEWRLVIVGEGQQRAALAQLVANLGMEHCTSFEGFVARPEEYMSRAGIFVLSSQFEGFPNALLESMAMGAAVVSSDCSSGPRELITDGIDGRLFKTGDVQELAAILKELMRDPEQRIRLGAKAVCVRSRFALEKVMAMWEGEIADVLRRHS